MASISNIPLFGSHSTFCSGAWFSLGRIPRREALVKIDDWTVQTDQKLPLVVVSGGCATSYTDSVTESMKIAQRGLDIMSVKGVDNLVLMSTDHGHAVWWEHDGLPTLRVLAHINVPMPRISFQIQISDGNQIVAEDGQRPAFMSTAAWDESFRYYRLSQCTDDLYEAYRSLYLALESLLSLIHPYTRGRGTRGRGTRGRGQRGEGDWLREAFLQASQLIDLTQYAAAAPPIKSLMADLYFGQRNALFHSKRGLSNLPHEKDVRSTTLAAYRRLLQLYLALISAKLDTHPSGQMTSLDLKRGISEVGIRSASMYVSDDTSEFDAHATGLPKAPARSVELESKLLPEDPSDPRSTIQGTSVITDELRDLHIRKIMTVVDGRPFYTETLEAALHLEGIGMFEAEISARGFDSLRPREFFGA